MQHLRGRTPVPTDREAHPVCSPWLGAALLVALASGVLAPPALAVSIRDLVALSQAGLSDDILIALIEADRNDFALDGPRILELRAQGISDDVILAMLNVSRERRAEAAASSEAPEAVNPDPHDGAPNFVIIGEEPEPPPPPRREVILVPWFQAGKRGARQPAAPVMSPEQRGFGRFMNDGWTHRRPAHTQ